MQLPRLFKIVTPILAITTTVTAIGNCKCQDSQGQYNDLTERCCAEQFSGVYHPDQHHQVGRSRRLISSPDAKIVS